MFTVCLSAAAQTPKHSRQAVTLCCHLLLPIFTQPALFTSTGCTDPVRLLHAPKLVQKCEGECVRTFKFTLTHPSWAPSELATTFLIQMALRTCEILSLFPSVWKGARQDARDIASPVARTWILQERGITQYNKHTHQSGRYHRSVDKDARLPCNPKSKETRHGCCPQRASC